MFRQIDHKEFNNCFDKFKNEWALLSVGPLDNHNAMTVAWAGLGYLWRKEVAFIFVRPSRHTFKFSENNDFFALSFFDEQYRDALSYYGTKSGRDVNKDEACNFHPFELNNVTIYEEARTTIICKKIYADDIKPELFLDNDIEKCYPDHSYHKMYICEVVAIYQTRASLYMPPWQERPPRHAFLTCQLPGPQPRGNRQETLTLPPGGLPFKDCRG